jgi:hypothetical protein
MRLHPDYGSKHESERDELAAGAGMIRRPVAGAGSAREDVALINAETARARLLTALRCMGPAGSNPRRSAPARHLSGRHRSYAQCTS